MLFPFSACSYTDRLVHALLTYGNGHSHDSHRAEMLRMTSTVWKWAFSCRASRIYDKYRKTMQQHSEYRSHDAACSEIDVAST